MSGVLKYKIVQIISDSLICCSSIL